MKMKGACIKRKIHMARLKSPIHARELLRNKLTSVCSFDSTNVSPFFRVHLPAKGNLIRKPIILLSPMLLTCHIL